MSIDSLACSMAILIVGLCFSLFFILPFNHHADNREKDRLNCVIKKYNTTSFTPMDWEKINNYCAKIYKNHALHCVIKEYNVTRFTPMDGEQISANGTYMDTYWTVNSIDKPEAVYAIYSWDNEKPIPGFYSCYWNYNKYLSFDLCTEHCRSRF